MEIEKIFRNFLKFFEFLRIGNSEIDEEHIIVLEVIFTASTVRRSKNKLNEQTNKRTNKQMN